MHSAAPKPQPRPLYSLDTTKASQRAAPTMEEQHSRYPRRQATWEDARRWNINPKLDLSQWNPDKDPIIVLGAAYDASSFGKWARRFVVGDYGPRSSISKAAEMLEDCLYDLYLHLPMARQMLAENRGRDMRKVLERMIERGEDLVGMIQDDCEICELDLNDSRRVKDLRQKYMNLAEWILGKHCGKDRQRFLDKFTKRVEEWGDDFRKLRR